MENEEEQGLALLLNEIKIPFKLSFFTKLFTEKDLESKYKIQFQTESIRIIRILIMNTLLYMLSMVGMIIYRVVKQEGNILYEGININMIVFLAIYLIFTILHYLLAKRYFWAIAIFSEVHTIFMFVACVEVNART